MNILISGASGLIGRFISQFWQAKNHQLRFLVRHQNPPKNHFYWDPTSGEINPAALANIDAVVHLSGESIMGLWTRKKIQRIQSSRVLSTQTLVKALKKQPPKLLICASGISIYGDRKDELLTEHSNHGTGFLASTCQAWEQAAQALQTTHTRVCQARLGIVLSREAGMLSQLLPLFRWGLGVHVGAQQAFLSWVSIAEVARVFDWIIHHPEFDGAFNLCTPNPTRQKEFYTALATSLNRPLWFSLPEILTQKLLGKMGAELLLSSQKATPEKLMQHGYVFQDKELKPTLKQLLH